MPGLAPAVLSMQGRARSEQTPLKITMVADAQSWWNDGEALREDGPAALKRSYSLPEAVLPNTSIAPKASAKPSFRIQLPSLDFFTLANTFSMHRRGVEPTIEKSYQSPGAGSSFNSSSVNDHAVTQVKLAPLITPPNEKITNSYITSSKGSEQITLLPKPTAATPHEGREPMSEKSHATTEHTEFASFSNDPATSDNTELSGFMGQSNSANPEASGAGSNSACWADEVMDVVGKIFHTK